MDELAKKRAEKKQDCREWSALDALEDLISCIKAGEFKPESLTIHFWERNEDQSRTHHYQVAGLTFPEHIALLEVGKNRVLNEWFQK